MVKRVRKRKTSSSSAVCAPGIDEIVTNTVNYYVNDFVVEIRVGEEVFKVASSRLKLHSPVFQEMFTLPQHDGIRSVTLHNDVDEFKDYLWYLHADPFVAKDFFESSSSADKCMRLLGIANVAHMYAAHDPGRRAVNEVMKMLMASGRPFHVDKSIARRILSLANRIYGDSAYQSADIMHCLFDQMCDVVCDAMYPLGEPGTSLGPLASDPIIAVKLARQAKNTDVLAHAYFYVLRMGDAYWQHDKRLDAVDRRRLLCGSHTLYSPFCAVLSPTPGLVRFGWEDAKIHTDIASRRENLWGFFDCEPWNLNRE